MMRLPKVDVSGRLLTAQVGRLAAVLMEVTKADSLSLVVQEQFEIVRACKRYSTTIKETTQPFSEPLS